MKTFSYRLYPNKRQKASLERIVEACRTFYNDCLEERKVAYEKEKRTVGKTEQMRRVKEFKKTERGFGVHSHALQVVVADLQKAFDAFFRRVKAGEKAGYPRFKGRNRFRSFGLKEYGNGFKIDGRRLRLSGVGRVSVRWHRPLEGRVKTVRVVRKGNKWYACFACEVENKPIELANHVGEIGIDVGLTSLLTLSNGEKVENPRWYRSSQKRLRVLQRRVARRKLGGSNRKKAVSVLANFAEHVANQRKDFLNKLASQLVGRFTHIAMEDLAVAGMVKGRFSKSILDAGWGYLKQRLLDKAANAGSSVVLVDPAYTSQDCCKCGLRKRLTLKDRWYTCECGNSRCRDENAALNILQAGRACWAPSPSMEGLAQEAAGL